MTRHQAELIYVADPMCSWCWGFAPVLDALLERYGGRCNLQMVMGGLRTGDNAQPMDNTLRSHLRHHWTEVERRTGQAFSWTLLDRQDFLYDTGPACRAVVTVRHWQPPRAYGFFVAVQQAFYGRGDDVTRPRTLAALAGLLELEPAEFLARFNGSAMVEATSADYRRAWALGAQGFPTLFLDTGPGRHLLCQGYQPYERLRPLMDTLLDD